MAGTIIVIGEVSVRQYEFLRTRVLRKGLTPKVLRFPLEDWRFKAVDRVVDAVGKDNFWGDMPINAGAGLCLEVNGILIRALGVPYSRISGIIINPNFPKIFSGNIEVSNSAFVDAVSFLLGTYPE